MTEKPIYHIILLRHGESIGNANGLFQGHSDFELSENGMLQTKQLATRWLDEGIRFDKVISSPLLRARQTAEVIAGTLGADVLLENDWMERDIGRFSGKPAAEIAELFPLTPYQPIGQTGESQWELYLRAGQALKNLLMRPPGRYLIVAHGGVINLALYAILGLPPPPGPSGPRFILANAAFADLTYSPTDHIWRLYSLNDRKHLTNISREQEPAPEVDPESEEQQIQGSGYAKSATINLSLPIDFARLNIRRARIHDLDGLLETFAVVDQLHAHSLPHLFSNPADPASPRDFYAVLISQPTTRLFVADMNDEIVGALYAYVQEAPNIPVMTPRRYVTISNLAVKPTYRRQGIGQALMEQAHNWCRQLAVTEVELTVWEFNEAGRRFYERLGYQTINRKMWLNLEGKV